MAEPDVDTSGTLYVDLDGTLIHSDLLFESCMQLLRANPLYLLMIPIWLMRGRANLKGNLADRIRPRADLLPYNHGLLHHLQQQRSTGRRLVLISASDQRLVDSVAQYLEMFDEAEGSRGGINLSGSTKRDRIMEREQGAPFAYAGDRVRDMPVWEKAAEIIAVNTPDRLTERLRRTGRLSQHIDSDRSPVREFLRAARPHQWLKNLLLFLPLLLTTEFYSSTLILQTTTGFLAFSLCASGVYLLNDMLDLADDRQHPGKRRRPFASGRLPLQAGLIGSPTLTLAAFAIALLWLPTYFVLVLAAYFLATLIYSFRLKQVMMVDVIMLAGLYTLRIIAGAAAIPIIPSFWLMAFSMFIFMSLAIIKRYTELLWLRQEDIKRSAGRGYLATDIDIMAIFGASSALIAVLVFALYINSEDIQNQYVTPEVLWFICPLLLYLLSRIWLLASRGEVHDDPLTFVLRDRGSQITALLSVGLIYLAHLDWRSTVFSVLLQAP